MSFILDALKKSELERQRQTIPGLMDAGPLERRPRFPLWAVALVVLLGVNLAVLLIVLLRSTPSSTHVDPGVRPPWPRRRRARRRAPSSPGASSPANPAPAASASAVSAPAEAPATLAPRAVGSPPAAPPARAAEHLGRWMRRRSTRRRFPPTTTLQRRAPGANERARRAGRRRSRARGASPGRTARARDAVLGPTRTRPTRRCCRPSARSIVGPAGPA